ncbi:MAG: glycosyltransferase family 2 protein [Bacteroidales bacterium]|nr:glycosyltransferase family 2 protein [Bacteroidales bacterium]
MEENKSPVLSVVIPVFNEQEILGELHERLVKSVSGITEDFELVFVDDGSHDRTFQRLIQITQSDPRVRYIRFSRNFGHQIAVTAGLDNCRGKVIVIIDGDLQDPPELIPELYSKYKEGYKVVYARRRKRKGETFFKKFTAKIFYRLLKRITSVDIPLDTGDFRLVDREIVEYLKKMPEQNKFLRGQIAWMGFSQTFVEFERDSRKTGKTQYSLRKMFRLAMDGITAFSDTPLKFATTIGFFVSLMAFVIILYALFSHFVLNRTITGWTSLIISTMFIGGIQLLAIGIIGEYISRINTNMRNRPLYIIEQTNIEKAQTE